MSSATLAITAATARSWRNGARRVRHQSPVGFALGALLVALFLASLVALQLQSALPLMTFVTPQSLTSTDLVAVGTIAVVGVAATAWGASLIMDLVGLTPATILAVAATRGVGRWRLAVGANLPTVTLAVVAALTLAGPVSLAFSSRALSGLATGDGNSLLLALLCVLAAAVTGAVAPLMIRATVQVVLGRHIADLSSRAVSGSFGALMLILGLGLIFMGNMQGAYVVLPPLMLTNGTPTSPGEVTLVMSGAAFICGAAAGVLALASHLQGRPVGGVAVLTGTTPRGRSWPSFVRGIRDPMCLAAVAMCLSGAVGLRLVAASSGGNLVEEAGLLVIALCGVASLSGSSIAYQWCTDAWGARLRPDGLRDSFVTVPLAVAVTGTAAALLTRAVIGGPMVIELEFTILGSSLAGSLFACAGVLITASTSHYHQRSNLLAGDLVGGALLLLVHIGLSRLAPVIGHLEHSWLVDVGVWLAAAAVALVATHGVRRLKWPEILPADDHTHG